MFAFFVHEVVVMEGSQVRSEVCARPVIGEVVYVLLLRLPDWIASGEGAFQRE